MRGLLETLSPCLAALAAAGIAPWLTGARWSTAFVAGFAVCLAVAAHTLYRYAAKRKARPVNLLAAGLGLVSLAGAAMLVLPSAAWLAAAIGLAASCLLAVAASELCRRLAEVDDELAGLRSRLVRREGDVRAQAERIRRLDLIDPVTGLLNHKGLAQAIGQSLAESAGRGQPLALLLVALPEPLPQAGGPGPDEIGQAVGRAVQQAVRGSDRAGRWGNDLVGLVLPRCNDPRPAIKRLRSLLSAAGVGEKTGSRLAGVTVPAAGPWPTVDELVGAAQAALSAAKKGPAGAEAAIWPVDWSLTPEAAPPPQAEVFN